MFIYSSPWSAQCSPHVLSWHRNGSVASPSAPLQPHLNGRLIQFLLYKRLFVSNNACESNTASHVYAASAAVAIWEDRLRTELINSDGFHRNMSPLLFSKAEDIGIPVADRG
jgi:hypothetical protein